MSRFEAFIKREAVLCISVLAAAVSCLFVPPDGAYIAYFDLRTLALLYCLMVVVAGLKGAGVFEAMARVLCARARTVRSLGLILVALCFFSSMLITNDVAILTFVPLSIAVLGFARQEKALVLVAVLQTVAANLGSMLTPVGNPQNLYLYSYYAMKAGRFFSTTGPAWLTSAVLLFILSLFLPKTALTVLPDDAPPCDRKRLIVYLALFCICLPVVFRIISWPYMLAAVVAVLLIFERNTLRKADFYLLMTFVCFFIFAGNLARIPAVDALLRTLLKGHTLLASAAASQIISNVPAAILLSGFTEDARALLLGVDIGGLGTPIASLASLIGLKLYAHVENADIKRFMLLFLIINFALLALLLCLCSVQL